jgi:endonuclease/exonuclease/phosphatase family metal-dependent hydrolase
VSTIATAFWNLQNLFDTQASDIAADLDFTAASGWNKAALDAKLDNLAAVIRTLNGGQGPDLLGLAEVETRELAEELVRRVGRADLAVAHVDRPDLRGIDTSLVYSSAVFEVMRAEAHLVHLRFRTRDIFEVELRHKATGAEVMVLINHWPSRRGAGAAASEPFRIAVASHCGRIVDGYLKLSRRDFVQLRDSRAAMACLQDRWNRNVLVMGDFNDEPFDRSVLSTLGAANSVDRIEEALKTSPSRRNLPAADSYLGQDAVLFNLAWSRLGEPDQGSCFFSAVGEPRTKQLFDQIAVSRGLYDGLQGLRARPGSFAIEAPSLMWTNRNADPAELRTIRPRPFDRETHLGYSDHFPVSCTIEVVD